MQLVNGTKFEFGANQALDVQGKASLVSLVKATYQIPEFSNEIPKIAEEQIPILDTDLFEGEPGHSAPIFESDWVLRKKQCDVIIKANAYPPSGKAINRLEAGFQVGDCQKTAIIHGPRQWEKNSWSTNLMIGEAEPFVEMPISYDLSFGGTWISDDQTQYECYADNPIGCGFATKQTERLVDQPAPSIESPDDPITSNIGNFKPWSFGPIGRNWSPRAALAGTYDEQWQQNQFPLLPTDFNEEFFQCAPRDQRIDFPSGGEEVVLFNLHPTRHEIRFQLPPKLKMPMIVLMSDQTQQIVTPVIDTIAIDVTQGVFSLVWRTQIPVRRSAKEIKLIAVGYVCKKWWRSQVFGSDDCGCGGTETDKDKLISIEEAIKV